MELLPIVVSIFAILTSSTALVTFIYNSKKASNERKEKLLNEGRQMEKCEQCQRDIDDAQKEIINIKSAQNSLSKDIEVIKTTQTHTLEMVKEIKEILNRKG